MMTILVRVKRVDSDGFNGRDFPPEAGDVGQEGVVTDIALIADPDDMLKPMVFTPWFQSWSTQVFYVVLRNGRKVQLMGHELELVGCTHDGDL